MSGRRRRNGKPLDGQFAPVYLELLRSLPWRLLPQTARALWPEAVAAARRAGKGDLSIPFQFPQRHRDFANNTVCTALRAYCELGMLTLVKAGGLFALASQYRLSDLWRTWSPARVENQARRKKWQDALERSKARDAAFERGRSEARERRAPLWRDSWLVCMTRKRKGIRA